VSGGRYIINSADSGVTAPSGDYPGAGTVFRYRRPASNDPYNRPAVETILAAGPTNSSIDIMVGCAIGKKPALSEDLSWVQKAIGLMAIT